MMTDFPSARSQCLLKTKFNCVHCMTEFTPRRLRSKNNPIARNHFKDVFNIFIKFELGKKLHCDTVALMKTLFLLLSLFTSTACMAQASGSGPAPTPAPTATPSEPNVLIANEGGITLAQMLLENTDGIALLKKTHHTGPLIRSSKTELVSESESTGDYPTWTTVIKFTIHSLDCLGTDACEGEYEWIVIATTVSSGFSYETTYKNTVKPFTHQKQ